MSQLTHALLRSETAVAAVEALRGATGKAEVEGLVELLYAPPSARAAIAAIAALEGNDTALVLDGLGRALESPHASVRIVAVQSLHQRQAVHVDRLLLRLLRQDESWLVRRAALAALADRPEPVRWQILDASTDPHWRVRHALIKVLLRWGQMPEQRREIDRWLAEAGQDARTRGLRSYLRYRWSGQVPESFVVSDSPDPREVCPVWDWDVAVLLRTLEGMRPSRQRRSLDMMPFLLGHSDARVRALAGETLQQWGQPQHLEEVLWLLDDLRSGAGESVLKLLGSLDLDRVEATARLLLGRHGGSAQLAWALDQAGTTFPCEEAESVLFGHIVRPRMYAPAGQALARLTARWPHPEADDWLRGFLDDADPEVQLEALRGLEHRPGISLDADTLGRLLDSDLPALRAEAVRIAFRCGIERGLVEPRADDPDPEVRVALATCLASRQDGLGEPLLTRLQGDLHPHVRAAALTPVLAAELVKDPARETSWHVLEKAARMAQVPFWNLEPNPPWWPETSPSVAAEPLHLTRPAPPFARPLGPQRLPVAPVGISGHYGLPVEGFVRAVEAGVNLLFWEPSYQTLIDFAVRLPASERNALHFIAGTFEADGKRVRRDAERALRMLQIDQLALFLIFWVQSWDRLNPDVRETLERLKEEGKVGMFGLSTHSRPLAVEAMEAGWNPVMVRHSAAHRGAEERVFSRAVELGTSLLTFNNTCYGRLLKSQGELPPPSPADCYRYTLGQPGVTACLSAPATVSQLEENLSALSDAALPPERWTQLRQQGDAVYREDSIFQKLVRVL